MRDVEEVEVTVLASTSLLAMPMVPSSLLMPPPPVALMGFQVELERTGKTDRTGKKGASATWWD